MVIKRTLKCGHEAEIDLSRDNPYCKRRRWPDMCPDCKRERAAQHAREWQARRRVKAKRASIPVALLQPVYEQPKALLIAPAVRHVTVSDVQDLSDGKLESVLTKLARGQLALTRIA
jgi:hypothetical protein